MKPLKNCPSCWRPIRFEEKYARILACWYCNSILEFWKWELSKIWEQAEFIEFPSQFIVGKYTEWKNKKVYIKGQLRYEYDWGFFDDFFVEIDWKTYYLEEDDWNQKLIKNWEWQENNINLIDKPVWEKVKINGADIFVQETWIFNLVWMKGFVNTTLIPWKSYEYLDWIYNWKMIYLEKIVGENKIRVNKEVEI